MIWLPLLATKVDKVASGLLDPEDADATFERAERDYFCSSSRPIRSTFIKDLSLAIPIYRAHLNFLTQGNLSGHKSSSLANDGDDIDSDFFSTNNVSKKCLDIVARVTAHTTQVRPIRCVLACLSSDLRASGSSRLE